MSYHHADVSHPLNTLGNVVTTAPVSVNLGEARMTLPLPGTKFDLAARAQDDQVRPRRGAVVAIEAALRLDL